MNAVRFIEERNRMCKSFDKCSYGCPAWDGSCKLKTGTNLGYEADKQVEIVKEWATAHPRKTRQSVFLEQYPEAEIDKRGDLMVCPKRISADCRNKYGNCTKSCSDCRREFWGKVVE